MNQATDILVAEHKIILRMIKVMSTSVEKIEKGGDINADVFLQAADFIQNFADSFHHAKEEDILFKLMGDKGIPVQAGPIGVMLSEHDHGRAFTRNMRSAAEKYKNGDSSAKLEMISNARNFAELLTQHIYKEDNILYPMANNAFSAEDQSFLLNEFEQVLQEKFSEGHQQKYLDMVEKLEK